MCYSPKRVANGDSLHFEARPEPLLQLSVDEEPLLVTESSESGIMSDDDGSQPVVGMDLKEQLVDRIGGLSVEVACRLISQQ